MQKNIVKTRPAPSLSGILDCQWLVVFEHAYLRFIVKRGFPMFVSRKPVFMLTKL